MAIPEIIKRDLDILFVGINPGTMSGRLQLHFANPQNLFWKALYQSRIIQQPWTAQQGNRLLYQQYNMSIVNLVQRTTASTTQLTRQEMKDGVPELCRKIDSCTPKIVCFVGIGIFNAFVDDWSTKVALGLQADRYQDTTLLFVMPSTSGRTAAYRNQEKLMYFNQLKYIHGCCCVNHSPIDHELLDSMGPQVVSKYFS